MKQEKLLLKRISKQKQLLYIILFSFCIYGIFACNSESLPTSSSGNILNGDNIFNNDTNSIKTNINTNIPLFDGNFPSPRTYADS